MIAIAADVLRFFKEKFSKDPHVYYSPGRINFIGEHVDYNDGFVMPAAINKGIYYAIALNNTDTINFESVDFNESLSVNIKDVKKMSGWKNYVLSVVNEFLAKNPGFRLETCRELFPFADHVDGAFVAKITR